MKGEVVTHQLDCAVAASAASAVTCPALVAAVRASCKPCASLPSVSQITRYLVKSRRGGAAPAGSVARWKSLAALQPGNPSTSLTRLESATSKSAYLKPA